MFHDFIDVNITVKVKTIEIMWSHTVQFNWAIEWMNEHSSVEANQ